MDVDAVMDEVALALEEIDGLGTYPYWADRISVPCAVVEFPDTISYAETYKRGGSRMTLPVRVLVARSPAPSARRMLAPYLKGSGPMSARAAVEDHETDAWDVATVTAMTECAVYSYAGVEYLGATLSIDIFGSGD
jgi:hypothetical protein